MSDEEDTAFFGGGKRKRASTPDGDEDEAPNSDDDVWDGEQDNDALDFRGDTRALIENMRHSARCQARADARHQRAEKQSRIMQEAMKHLTDENLLRRLFLCTRADYSRRMPHLINMALLIRQKHPTWSDGNMLSVMCSVARAAYAAMDAGVEQASEWLLFLLAAAKLPNRNAQESRDYMKRRAEYTADVLRTAIVMDPTKLAGGSTDSIMGAAALFHELRKDGNGRRAARGDARQEDALV